MEIKKYNNNKIIKNNDDNKILGYDNSYLNNINNAQKFEQIISLLKNTTTGTVVNKKTNEVKSEINSMIMIINQGTYVKDLYNFILNSNDKTYKIIKKK